MAFDSGAEWVVPLRPAADRTAIIKQVATIGAGGGTDMYPALEQAWAALSRVTTNFKHIILLTDGQSMPGNFEALANGCGDSGITISTIAVGPDADRALLARIAQLSDGRMYTAQSAQTLPQIFVRETVLASRSGLFEQPFLPQLRPTIDESILAGVSASEIPQLQGHVITSAKPMTYVPLVRATEDDAFPILAYWQVGLGRSVAFTSGMWPRWGPQWAGWAKFSKIWTQAARYAARSQAPGNLEIETTIVRGEGHVSISAEHLPTRTQSSLNLLGQVIGPDHSVTPLQMQRVGFGRFEATFPVNTPGTYLLSMPYSLGTGGDAQTGVLQTGAVLSYSPEYRAIRDNEVNIG